jgi:hypothetical protein
MAEVQVLSSQEMHLFLEKQHAFIFLPNAMAETCLHETM